jgi:uncharacterized membrane protein YidH (DUF202 family)
MTGPESGGRLPYLGWDPGVQNERTALAWQRTALAIIAGAAILARLTEHRLGVWALVPLVVAAPLGGWAFLESRRRYLRSAHVTEDLRRRGGRGPLTLTLAVVVIGATELAALLLQPR